MRRYWPEIAWGAFAAANVVAMFLLPAWQTVPFHFIWISLTLLYGVRVWGWRLTVIVLGAVMIATTLGELHPGTPGEFDMPELTEVPLMGAVFLAMVWHAQRRQAALRELARAAERERDFLRDASHQLRTPITIARGHAQLIRQATTDAETLGDVDVVLDELDTLASASDRLLTLAAADHGDFLSLAPARLDILVRQTADRWRPCADRRWTVRAGGPIVADADLARITVALDALIENAVNHTSPGDEITLSAACDERSATVAVSDSGSGIPPEAVDRVFERFASRSQGRRGTGLGLPMARAIARAHGGDAALLGTAPGHGTTMELRIPLTAPAGP